MKKICILIFILSVSINSNAQQIRWDSATSLWFGAWRAAAKIVQPKIIKNEKQMIILQDSINDWLLDIKKIEQHNVDYLSEKQSYAVDIEDLEYIIRILSDITDYQIKAARLVKNNPALTKAAQDVERQLILRGANLIKEIAGLAKKDGNLNMLNNKERNNIIIHVFEELRTMRLVASDLCRQLEIADKRRYLDTDLSTLLQKMNKN